MLCFLRNDKVSIWKFYFLQYERHSLLPKV